MKLFLFVSFVFALIANLANAETAKVAKSQILNEFLLGMDDDFDAKSLNQGDERKASLKILDSILVNREGNSQLRIDRKTAKPTALTNSVLNTSTAKVKNREIKLYYRATTRDLKQQNKNSNMRLKTENVSPEHTSILKFYNVDESYFVLRINKELFLVVFCLSVVIVLAFSFLTCLVQCVSVSRKDAYYFCKYHQIS